MCEIPSTQSQCCPSGVIPEAPNSYFCFFFLYIELVFSFSLLISIVIWINFLILLENSILKKWNFIVLTSKPWDVTQFYNSIILSPAPFVLHVKDRSIFSSLLFWKINNTEGKITQKFRNHRTPLNKNLYEKASTLISRGFHSTNRYHLTRKLFSWCKFSWISFIREVRILSEIYPNKDHS